MIKESEDLAEEYYNCGYDGMYESKGKAEIFSCVGRGLKIPPLSEVVFPSFVLKRRSKPHVDTKPSHHVLEFIAPSEAHYQSSCLQNHDSNHCSSQKDQSELGCILSDHDPVLKTTPAYFEKNKVSYSTSVNKNFMKEAGGPEEAGAAAAHNLNTDATRSVENVALGNELKICNRASVKFGDFFQRTTTASAKHEVGDQNSSLKPHCDSFLTTSATTKHKINNYKNRKNTWKSRSSAENNSCLWNDVGSGEMMSGGSKREEDFFYNHFTTFKKDPELALNCQLEFPALPVKQIQDPPKPNQAGSLSENNLELNSCEDLPPCSNSLNSDNGSCNVEILRKKVIKTPNKSLLVIENLPRSVTRESLKNFLVQFGEVIFIILLPLSESITARIRIDSQLEWIIDCLDGTDAFGAETQPLRCYQE